LFAAIAAMVSPPTLDSVLLIEEDPEILGVLHPALADNGFKVSVAKDGLAGLKAARAEIPAADIIGKLLSDMRSEYVCRELKTNRHTAHIPVMVLTGAPRGGPRVGAVWPPADVYLSKFYGPEEVIAKLQGMIRLQADRAKAPVVFGPFKLNHFHGEIHVDGERLDLTLTEFKLLAMLIDKRGRVISREVLLRDIWGYTRRHKSRTADIHVHRVRSKLGAHASMLETIHGGGYRLRAEPEL
jgi:two-component system phosphate regulon response regulator PhoB